MKQELIKYLTVSYWYLNVSTAKVNKENKYLRGRSLENKTFAFYYYKILCCSLPFNVVENKMGHSSEATLMSTSNAEFVEIRCCYNLK